MKNIKISNPDKVIYPKQKITKLDIVKYYLSVSKKMLPFISNRLLSVIRCHEGIIGECFYKKHPTTDKDIKTYTDDDEEYFYIDKQAELLMQAQNGTIEFHPWGSLVSKINQPDIMVFDLDPDTKLPLSKLREAVLKVKSVIDELNLVSFLKTSGGKGYHIVLPFSSTKDWISFYDFSKQIALLVESKWQNLFTTNIKKTERKGKIFIDYLRNNRGSTCVAPYSLRARDNATISMPIDWEDLYKIKPNEVTIKNFEKFLNNSWNNFFRVKQKLK